MKQRIYRILVNRVPGIRDRYLHFRERGGRRVAALWYLLWLNIQYYLFFRRSLAVPARFLTYEEKTLCIKGSESSLSRQEPPAAFAAKLAEADVISFDVFDTLLFRPFSHSTDVFLLLGMELQYPDFKRIRIEAEARARKKKHDAAGTWEVTLEEIWDVMEQETGIPKTTGLQAEWACEQKSCYANPYMLCVVEKLQSLGKRLVATSDMYLGEKRIRELLKGCGYGAFSDCFVSCDYGVSKSDGHLYDVMREKTGGTGIYAHVGDHPVSDWEKARRRGMRSYLYPNVHHTGARYRAQDMSALTGSVYRGLVDAHIYSGLNVFSREYEYGYLYGGLFVCGYCRFIHAYVQRSKMEKILFLSRDGAVLMEAYRRMYPEETCVTEYVYWSRLAAVKLTARYFKYDYFRRFLYHKADQHYTIRQILDGMELTHLLQPLCRDVKANPEDELTHKNIDTIKNYLMDIWQQVLDSYEEQVTAGGLYMCSVLQGCHKAAAVDIGWAGSGAVMLDTAVNRLWGMDCNITGIVAGTNSCHSSEPDAGEPFFLSGQMVSYLFSQRENRDLWKFHNPAEGHNLYWELLLGAQEGSLIGFYLDQTGNPVCRFKKKPSSAGEIREIHRGILDFVQQFLEAEQRLDVNLPISGRDAYAPMLIPCSRGNKKFMKGLERMLDEMHIV